MRALTLFVVACVAACVFGDVLDVVYEIDPKHATNDWKTEVNIMLNIAINGLDGWLRREFETLNERRAAMAESGELAAMATALWTCALTLTLLIIGDKFLA